MKVHFETSGPLAILALANPPLNLLSGELLDELGAAVRELKRLPIRALMLRAEGKVFSAGADVSAIGDSPRWHQRFPRDACRNAKLRRDFHQQSGCR